MMMLSGLGQVSELSKEDAEALLEALEDDATDKFRYELYCWAAHMSRRSMNAKDKLEALLALPDIPFSDRTKYEKDIPIHAANHIQYRRLRDFAIAAQWEVDDGEGWKPFEPDGKCPANPPKPDRSGLGAPPVAIGALIAQGAVKIFVWASLAYVVVKSIQTIIETFFNQESVEDQIKRVNAINECIQQNRNAGMDNKSAIQSCRELFPAPSPSFFTPITIVALGVGIWLFVKYKDDILPGKSPSGASA
tara:strand:+ start:512 stop:1258 length:747 start_codon:yes stop_codon:yes gene_type:complete